MKTTNEKLEEIKQYISDILDYDKYMKLKEDMEIFNFDKVVNKLTINYILRIYCKIVTLK